MSPEGEEVEEEEVHEDAEESATAVVVEEEDASAAALFGFDAVSVDEDSDDMDSSSCRFAA